ncbi:hypothetical protein SAMN05216266_10871 [Amycolatopsis marina]|uniref:Uncharacterized protein n=1 Tax=Amycolatopsis marina TaxID=490629 RepID=A0A1I1A0X0_9PSEU|nr:hypothetical protein [Amycolatopsis marina]SFB31467.1 hypothetical protein SAMN05216266_10871 [Amycolatopsis marina]
MISDEATRLTATVQHAVTFSSRTVGEVKARNERYRAENARQVSGATSAAAATPEHLRAAARRFRIGQGLPLPEAEERVPVRRTRQTEPPMGDEEADFSQARIMVREDGTPPPPSFYRD